MMNSNPQLSTQLQKPNSFLTIAILIVSFLGFVDAAYLTVSHYQNKIPPCSLTEGCEKVLTSSYSSIAGVPLALLGSLFYIALFFLVLAYRNKPDERLLKLLMVMFTIGLLTSLTLLSLQLWVIQAICIYCLGSFFANVIIAPLGILLWKRRGAFL